MPGETTDRGQIAEKLLRWLMLGVVVSLLPIAFAWLNAAMRPQSGSLVRILGGGELLITTAAMCAGALGELFPGSRRNVVPKIVSAGATVTVLLVSALMFAVQSTSEGGTRAYGDSRIAAASAILFVFALITCTACPILSVDSR